MAEQQFCLRWNNFQSNIVASFEALLSREEFVDVTLTAEGKSLKAHRILLSACSPYFRDLFRELPSHQHPIIVLRDTCFQELKSLLNFIYHGEVNVSQERLGMLLKLAEALRIKGLAQDKKSRENNEQFGNQNVSPEKEPEEGLDRGRSGGPGSPALSLVGFPGVTGLPPGNPLVPLEPPSHKQQPPQLLHSSPPAKRHKPIQSPLAGPILLPLSTPQKELLNSHQTPPVSNSSSQNDEELSSTPRVINLTMGNNGDPSPPPKISVVPKTELQEDVEGAQEKERERERESGRGGSLGGSGSGGGEGSSDREDDLKEEDDMDNEYHLNTFDHKHDLSGLPPHLTAAVQNFVPYAAAAAAAAGSSQLDNYPGPSGAMPPASQPGWRGGPHSEPTDTSAQDYQLLQKLQFISASHQYMHWPSRRPAVCPGCGKFFKFKYNMKIHLKKCMNAQMSSQVISGLHSGDRGEDISSHTQPMNSQSLSLTPTSMTFTSMPMSLPSPTLSMSMTSPSMSLTPPSMSLTSPPMSLSITGGHPTAVPPPPPPPHPHGAHSTS